MLKAYLEQSCSLHPLIIKWEHVKRNFHHLSRSSSGVFSRTFQISFAGKTTYQFEEVFSISFQKRCIADSYCVRATVIINDIKWEHVTTKRDVPIMFFQGEAPAVQCFLSLFKYLPSLKLLASLKKYLMSLQKRCVADSY